MKWPPMKRQSLIYILYGVLCSGCMTAGLPAFADIYSWTDENGVRHYSDTLPEDAGMVTVTPEIPHDSEADQNTWQAHQEMIRQVEQEQRESEKNELEERLKRTEKKLQTAERKADKALEEAKAARNIAEEKQRRREVYVVPWIGPRKNRVPRPVPYDPYQSRHPRN